MKMKNWKVLLIVALAAAAIWYFYIRKPKAAAPAQAGTTPAVAGTAA